VIAPIDDLVRDIAGELRTLCGDGGPSTIVIRREDAVYVVLCSGAEIEVVLTLDPLTVVGD
jgi:hypothetical protein